MNVNISDSQALSCIMHSTRRVVIDKLSARVPGLHDSEMRTPLWRLPSSLNPSLSSESATLHRRLGYCVHELGAASESKLKFPTTLGPTAGTRVRFTRAMSESAFSVE